ncbi:MAG TPA: type I phosphomannose isomerase catalytic subunit [Polyangiaceae bacterium]|jgi:mannose-6-phosphate isomerase|nr:type I phosphomannose isomerase catalytic subunit [Polyangiaceae bacterium]
MKPEKLRPDNFTPPTRTPWGGTRILERYKAGLGIQAQGAVGESWEVSVEPSFPSRLVSRDETLASLIARDPSAWLGRPAEQTPLLVKLLDAADNLSVQVHPADGDPALAPDESGKPEAWIVLDADPGAGLYLGFREGVGRREVEACIASGGALDALMNFVVVKPGEAFLIDAGTPHAIGRGLTLLEPQHVAPDKRGVTYRFWDWNRRYDSEGRLDSHGKPRELHVERSLDVTDWNAPRGAAFVDRCRAARKALEPHRDRCVSWPWFDVERWYGTGTLSLTVDSLHAIVCLGGHVRIVTGAGSLALRMGESGVVPAAAVDVELSDALVFATYQRAGHKMNL